jgi:ABC-type cobalamin transport system permease subunit
MPSEVVDHSARTLAVQIGFWIFVPAVAAIAVGYGNSVALAGVAFGGAILASAVVLELTETHRATD